MHYTLMHKEIPVVDIELDDASGAITRVDDVHNAAHIPIGIAYKNDILDRKALNKWWYGRSIPASRARRISSIACACISVRPKRAINFSFASL